MPAHSPPRARRPGGALFAGVLALVLVACTGGPVGDVVDGRGAQDGPRPAERPNVVLITTDDQTRTDLDAMPRTRRLLGASGVELTDFLSPHPLCCPARAHVLTGSYAHNNGVRHNSGPRGGYAAFAEAGHLEENLGVWLQRAGYSTAFVGKMLNGYRPRHDPPPLGWDVWRPSAKGTYAYVDTEFLHDGSRPDREASYRTAEGYVTDRVAAYATALVRRLGSREKPFFLWVSHVAPHTTMDGKGTRSPLSAPRHRGMFRGAEPPARSKPTYLAEGRDRPAPVRREQGRGGSGTDAKDLDDSLQRLHRARLRSLQAVDEANAAVVRALRLAGAWEDTVVVFTSDNGFQLGEHGLVGKNYPYEASLGVPFLIVGPDVPADRRLSGGGTLVDLAPTILSYAGVLEQLRGEGRLDGEDLRRLWTRDRDDAGTGGGTQLIQGGTNARRALADYGWSWRGVRTDRYTYVRWFTGEEELYDRDRDPDQRRNVVDGRRYAEVAEALRGRLEQLKSCAGVEECERASFPSLPAPLARR